MSQHTITLNAEAAKYLADHLRNMNVAQREASIVLAALTKGHVAGDVSLVHLEPETGVLVVESPG